MALTMHQISVRVFQRHLRGLAGCLTKARALYQEKKFDEASLLSYRFYPDMFDFARQVRSATNHARQCTEMLSGRAAPKLDDNERSLEELIARVQKTIDYLNAVTPEELDGAEEKAVSVKIGGRDTSLSGADLLLKRSMPNFYFHVTTAYDILRHNGVEIGKADFMGAS